MAEEKYISKVRIGGENFVIRDKAAFTAANSLQIRVKAVEDSIKGMAGLTPAQLQEITNNINLIKQELEGTPANDWATLVDKLAGIEGTVKTYVNTAVDGAKAYTNTKTSEAIGVAASDATTKANNAKTAAINAAASDAKTKADNALAEAKAYADIKKTEAIANVQGSDGDTSSDDTIWGTKLYVDEEVSAAKNSLIGKSTDATTADTIWGAKNYAAGIQTDLLGKDGDLWPTQHTIYGVAKYADTTVKNSLIGQEGDQTIETHYGVKFLSYYYTDYAKDHLIGSYTDVAESETIYGAKKYTDEKIKTLSNTAFKVSRIEEGSEGILVFSTVSGQQLS